MIQVPATLLLGLLLSSSLSAVSLKYSVNDYIKDLKKVDPLLKTIEKEYIQLEKKLELNREAWELDLAVSHQVNQKSTPETSSTLGLSLPQTGTSLNLSRTSSFSSSGQQLESIDVKVSQSIWQGAFGSLYQEQQKSFQIAKRKNDLDREQAMASYWYARIGLFQQLAVMNKSLSVRKSILKDNKAILSYVKKRFKSHIARRSELLEVEAKYLDEKQSVASLENDIRESRSMIEEFTGKSLKSVDVQYELTLDKLTRLSPRAIKLVQEDLNYTESLLEQALEQEKTDATLFLGFSHKTGFSRQVDQAYAGFSVELPLRNSQKKMQTRYLRSQAAWYTHKIKSEQKLMSLQEKNLNREYKTLEAQLEVAKKVLSLREEIKELKWVRYQSSRITFREWIEAQSQYEQQRLKVIEQINELQKKALERALVFNQILPLSSI